MVSLDSPKSTDTDHGRKQSQKESTNPPDILLSTDIGQEPDALSPPYLLGELLPCAPVHSSARPLTGRNTQSRVTQSALFHFVEWIWAIVYADDNSSSLTVASLQVNIRRWIGIKLELALRIRAHDRLWAVQIDRISMSMAYSVPLDRPFMTACACGDIVSVRTTLREEPASVTYYSEGGVTPLSLAI